MKKYVLTAFLSALAALLFISCEAEPVYLPVSQDTAEPESTETEGSLISEQAGWEYEPAVTEPTEITVSNDYVFTSYFPVVTIETEKPIDSKHSYVSGTMNIRMGDKILYGDTVSDIEIKLRGNSSLGFEKKPFKIKLAEKADFFGYSKSRHWILLACMFDRSLIRDKLGLDLSSLYFDYYTKSTWVEVILNGKYIGTFQLCEQIHIEKDRLNITDIEKIVEEKQIDISEYVEENGYDITGGYLLEVSVQYDESSKFKTALMDIPVMVKKPEEASKNREMMRYLQKYMQDFELAIRSDDMISTNGLHYTELFDFEDLVNYWVISSFYKTHDFMINSTYLYKDAADENGVEDKMHMGPIWDIGNSLGNFTSANNWILPTKPKTWDSPSDDYANWYKEICKDPYFMVRAQEAFCELIEPVEEITAEGGLLDSYRELLRSSVDANQVLYPTFKNSVHGLPKIKNLDEEVDWIREYMLERLAFMSAELADLKNISLVYCTFTSGDESIGIKLTDENGIELPAGVYENKLGVSADYAADCKSPVGIEIETALDKAYRAGIYVNDCKVGEFELADGKLQAVIAQSYLYSSPSVKNVLTVRLYDNKNIWLATDFVTLATK